MKEFVEKLIGRLEELSEGELCDLVSHEVCKKYKNCKECYKNLATEFVNELTEEYKHCTLCYLGSPCEYQNKDAILPNELLAENNGWIPCSERLPEENGYYLITIKYYHLHNNVTMGCFFDDGEWWKIDKDDKVIAWQPLPDPYIPKQEEQKG